jgi:putative DNA primase/helicase
MPEDFFEDGKFQVNKLGFAFMQEYNVLTFNDTKTMLIYDPESGLWVPRAEITLQNYVVEKLIARYRRNLYEEVLSYIKGITYFDRVKIDAEKNLLCLKNGVYNLATHQFMEHSPDYFFTIGLPVIYDKEASCPRIIDFLHEVVQDDVIPMLQEFLGYCLWRDYPIHRAFIFTGSGSNGKSTLLNLFREFLGPNNVVNISLQNIDNQRFASSQMYGKLANLCNDIPKKSLVNTGIFKQLCGGDAVYAEKKYKDPFSFRNFAKMCFSCNQLPETHDDTDAFFRRIVIVDFPHQFTGERCDPDILEKLTSESELSGLFNWAVIGLERLQIRKTFSVSLSAEETARDYKKKSSPIQAFLMDMIEKSPNSSIPKEELYDAYTQYCDENELTVLEKGPFGKKLRTHAPHITEKQGRHGEKRIRMWVGIAFRLCDTQTEEAEKSLLNYSNILKI